MHSLCRYSVGSLAVSFLLGAIPSKSFAGVATVDVQTFWSMGIQYNDGIVTPDPAAISFVQFGASGIDLVDSVASGRKTDVVSASGGYLLSNSDPHNTGTTVLLSAYGAAGNPFTLYVSDGRYDVASYSAYVDGGFWLYDTHFGSTAAAGCDQNCVRDTLSNPPAISATDLLADYTGQEDVPVTVPAPGDVVAFDFTAQTIATMMVPEPATWPIWVIGIGGVTGLRARPRAVSGADRNRL
jgi:hypothetical protein